MIDTNKHILLVTSEFPPQPGGIGNHAYNLAKHLKQNNFEVDVITDQRSASGKEEETFDSLLKFNVHRVALHKLRIRMYLKRIGLLLYKMKSSEIVIASGKFSLWIVAAVSLFYKRKYIAVIHGSEVNFTKKIKKKAVNMSLKRFFKLIAVSNFTKSLVTSLHNNIIVISNGIDFEQFQNTIAKKKTIVGQPKLITVGNVTDRKGQLNVINQLPELLKVYPNLHYHCVGLPTQQDIFFKRAQALNVDTNITFHGRVSEEELQALLKSSDIFVMLSRPTKTGDVEGFGIALIEANFFELPCIGSKGCGIEDAIEDYKSGRLINYDNSSELKSAIQEILSNYDHYKSGAKAWSLKHDWASIVKQYIKEFEL